MDNEREMIIKELTKILSYKETQTLLKKKLQKNWKNSEQSRKLRIEGNDSYGKASNALQMEETYKLYSRSIAFAELDSEELSLAYGNRSAILFRMKKYKECIADIDSATKINNSDKFKIKLLCRKIECINLQGLTKNEEIFSEVESLVSLTEDDTTKEEYKKLFEKSKNSKATEVLKSENKEIPKLVKILQEKENENPFDSVSIKWNEKYGRYLIANRDFNAGEIVFFENPYVKILNLKNFHMYCGHCLATCWATIPCNYCNWCMFCSEECKNASWEQYHNIECTIVAQILKKYGKISHYEQETIRSLICGIKDAGSIQNLKSELESLDTCTDKSVKGFSSNGSCKSMGFKSMYTLNGDVAANRLPIYTTNSVFILLYLIKSSSLFDATLKYNPENILTNDEVLFIGSLILKIYKVTDKNSQQLPGEDRSACKYSNDNVTCNTLQCCNNGFATLTIVSLINNSCHPHVINVINKQSKFIVCSIRPIKKDSQIFITYCGEWTDMPKHNRQMILKAGFNFTCDCEACEQNWPTLQQLVMSMQNIPITTMRKERCHMYANDITVRPFFEDQSNVKCTLKTIQILSKAISEAYKDLKHPSATLVKLEECMRRAVIKLYRI